MGIRSAIFVMERLMDNETELIERTWEHPFKDNMIVLQDRNLNWTLIEYNGSIRPGRETSFIVGPNDYWMVWDNIDLAKYFVQIP